MIPGLYTYVAVGAAALAIGFGGGWKTNGWRWDASEKQRIEQETKDLHRVTERANASSGAYEGKKAANEIRYRTVTVMLEKIVERPVYLAACLDPDGLRELNQQIARSTDSGQPSLKLPKP